MENNDKPNFELISKGEPLDLIKNIYYNSKQKIVQSNGSSSDHIVLKKQAVGQDGAPQGSARQLFIPVADAVQVLEHALNYNKYSLVVRVFVWIGDLSPFLLFFYVVVGVGGWCILKR